MTSNIKRLLSLLLALFIIASTVVVLQVVHEADASTDRSNYLSSRITSANASSSVGTRLMGPGTLGSVIVINGSSASTTAETTIGIYDGSSTATSSATLIATFNTSTSAGVYTFDVQASQGLIIDVPRGFTGQYVVTYRL